LQNKRLLTSEVIPSDSVLLDSMAHGSSNIRILVSGAPLLGCDAISFHLAAQPGFVVIGQMDAAGIVEGVGRLDPDILLVIELDSVSKTWMTTVSAVKVASRTRIIVVTYPLDKSTMLQAIEMGVRGFLTRESHMEMLFKSIRCVVAGEYWIGHDRTADLVDYLRSRSNGEPAPADNFGLTLRQREVVHSILRGYSNKEIARHFGISGETVKHHLTSIFEKLCVANRLELALFAVKHPQIAPNNLPDRKKHKK
jgi:two-component system nitrate/nitrite response regulator NarL